MNTTDYMGINSSGGVIYYGWVEWNTSIISDTATVHAVQLRIEHYNTYVNGCNVRHMAFQPTTRTVQQIETDSGDGLIYGNWTGGTQGTTTQIYLEGAASTLQGDLASDWFAVGIRHIETDEDRRITTSEGGYSPRLLVETDEGTYTLLLYGLYYENGTNAGSVTVSTHDAHGDYEYDFTGSARLGFNSTPLMMDWPASSDTRRIVPTSDAAQTYYLFTPESTYSLYEFTITDYTGRLGAGSAFLEAYRPVNITERLIERNTIQSTVNTAVMTLVYGKLYHIQILFADGSRYDWGYWLAGTDATPTIVISDLEFDALSQLTYRYINLESTRVNSTHIQVLYNDTTPGYGTDWVNISVWDRTLSTKQTSLNSTAETVTFNWYGANSTLDYWVQVEVDHAFYTRTLEYLRLLDAPRTFETFPSLEPLGTFGNIDQRSALSAFIVLIAFASFSRESADVALILSCSIAGALRYMGANSWSWNVIILAFSLSVGFAIFRGRVRV